MEKIIVTGAAGFIGSNLCKALLSHNYHVVGIDDFSAGTRANLAKGIEFHELDISRDGLTPVFENATTVFHLAAKNCLADCAANPIDTARINVVGTAKVMEASISAKVPHLVYSDSSAEYEGIEEFPSRVERIAPRSVYASSKRGGALVCESLARIHPIEVSTVRYFNVYGPAQDWRRVIPPVMSAFTINLLCGKRPTLYGTGEKSRDFIHVDDVNAFHLKLLQDLKTRGQIYNLGSGKTTTILEVFERIESQIQSGLTPINKPELPEEAECTLADISATLKTGWAPRVDLESGLRRFIDYVRGELGKTIQPDKHHYEARAEANP